MPSVHGRVQLFSLAVTVGLPSIVILIESRNEPFMPSINTGEVLDDVGMTTSHIFSSLESIQSAVPLASASMPPRLLSSSELIFRYVLLATLFQRNCRLF